VVRVGVRYFPMNLVIVRPIFSTEESPARAVAEVDKFGATRARSRPRQQFPRTICIFQAGRSDAWAPSVNFGLVEIGPAHDWGAI